MLLSSGAPKTPPAFNAGQSFAAEQALAALSVVGVVVLIMLLVRLRAHRPSHGGLVTGADNRYSTGRVIAIGWTLVIAWMVVTEAYIATSEDGTTFAGLLSGASLLYFVFLGGPYAAAAFALLSTQTKISQGNLTKIPAEAPNAVDVVTDDNGNIDTYDFQYTLFNLLALFIVVVAFAGHAGSGLPEIPQFLAILTGGSALTYTVNKALVSSGPQITKVDPPNARVGDRLTITGVQLFSNQAGGALPTVTIGGIGATAVTVPPASMNALTAVVAAPPSNTTPLAGPVDVIVSPPLATPIVLRGGVTIVADQPTIVEVTPNPFEVSKAITVKGTFLLAPGTADGIVAGATANVGSMVATLTTVTNVAFPVKFTGAYSNEEVSLLVDPPAGPVGQSGDLVKCALTLSRGTTSALIAELEYKVP